MVTLIANIVGYAAAVVGTSLMLPQIIKSLKTKKVKDISFIMLMFYFLNCILWLIYGVLISATPVIVANSIALLISIFQIMLKIIYS